MIVLRERISIYIPSEFKSEIIRTQSKFNSNFGGSTLITGTGSWNGSKGVEIEDITIIYSNVFEINDEIRSFIMDLSKHVKRMCKQEAVSFELNNELYLV